MGIRILYNNKRISSIFTIIDKLEVGIVLRGWEVKSFKAGHVNMSGAYVAYTPAGELWLRGIVVSPWKTAPSVSKEEQERPRKLLAQRKQAIKIGNLSMQPGYTLVPLEAYVNEKGLIKLVIALAKGKRKFERKQELKERDLQKQVDRDLKEYGF